MDANDPTPPYPDSVAEPDTPARRDRRLAIGLILGTAAALTAAMFWFTRSPGPPTTPFALRATGTTCEPPCEVLEPVVTLTWAPPESGAEASGYRLFRDGTPLEPEVGTTELSYVDDDVTIGETYAYEVVALSGEGDSARTAAVLATVPTPSADAAHLHGIYRVELTVRSARSIGAAFGIDDPLPGARGTDRWSFESTCGAEEGTCPSMWSGLEGTIEPDGSRWQGTVEGLPARCGDQGRAPAPIEVDLEAVDVGVVDGSWAVTGFRGTATVSFRCPGFPAASARVDVTGSM
jgi:hypothetical protein